MPTELQNNRLAGQIETNVSAAQSVSINPGNNSTIPTVIQERDLIQEALAYKNTLPLVEPPSEDRIREQMWIASGVMGLLGAIVSGNPAGGIASGMVAALGVHDRGYALRKRSQYLMDLHDQGFTKRAILNWYETGDNKELDKEWEAINKMAEKQHESDQRAAEFAVTEKDKLLDREQELGIAHAQMANSIAIANLHERGANERARAESKNTANMRDYKFFHGLTPEQQKEYLQMHGGKGAPLLFDPKSPTAVSDAQGVVSAGTADQRKDASLAYRMKTQAVVMRHLLSSDLVSPRRAGAIISALGAGTLGNLALSAEEQMFVNAASEVVNASMRRESGAAIPEGEWKTARERLLPDAGDTDQLIVKKMNNIEDQINDYAASSGAVYPALEYLAENRRVVSQTKLEQVEQPSGGTNYGTVSGIPSNLKPGDTVNGYVYQGGDINSKSAWVKA